MKEACAGDGVDLLSRGHLHPRPYHLSHRRQERFRGHGSLLLRWKQHLWRHSRVSCLFLAFLISLSLRKFFINLFASQFSTGNFSHKRQSNLHAPSLKMKQMFSLQTIYIHTYVENSKWSINWDYFTCEQFLWAQFSFQISSDLLLILGTINSPKLDVFLEIFQRGVIFDKKDCKKIPKQFSKNNGSRGILEISKKQKHWGSELSLGVP